MLHRINKSNLAYFCYFYLVIYTFVNICFLENFPFMHSDESWLSGLSRNMLESESFSVTESFFDLFPREPHAIKILFHSLQISIIKVFGYSLFNMRMISLVFGILSLLFFYKIIQQIFSNHWLSLLTTIMISVDIQFIYASHFARQEILLFFIFIYAFYYNISHIHHISIKHSIVTGILIGISIGIHPNSFIISLPFIGIYGYLLICSRKNFRLLAVYISILASFATFYILLSISFNPGFISDYTQYGSTLGVTNSIGAKISQFKDFLLKLYFGISGTYYTPKIKFEFYFFIVSALAAIYYTYQEEHIILRTFNRVSILGIISILAGIIAIGRYNQTSIIFFFPFLYFLIAYVLTKIKPSFRVSIASIIIFILVMNSIVNIYPYTNIDYNRYLNQVSKAIPKDTNVLGNLNAEYYFENQKLYDYRNLAYLEAYNLSFSDYIRKNNIEYIIYPEEMDFIYNTRPVWNGLYGNIYPYYDEMQIFLKEDCTLIHSFTNHYGMRIARYFLDKEWEINIYKVNIE